MSACTILLRGASKDVILLFNLGIKWNGKKFTRRYVCR
jgi:hypothetical protein